MGNITCDCQVLELVLGLVLELVLELLHRSCNYFELGLLMFLLHDSLPSIDCLLGLHHIAQMHSNQNNNQLKSIEILSPLDPNIVLQLELCKKLVLELVLELVVW